MIMSRKGYILVTILVLLVVTAIASISLYSAIHLSGKIIGIDEVRRIRGYYAASAGLSYASAILAGSSIPASPISVKNTYPALWGNLGLVAPEDVVIEITVRSDKRYDVTSTFTFFAEEISLVAIVPKPIGGTPRTGQTIQYSGKPDDGYYRMGNPATPRFTALTDANGAPDGTVVDDATGLMWEQKTNIVGDIHYFGSAYTWEEAFGVFLYGPAGLNTVCFAGYDDWRIPNIIELQSIQDPTRISGPYVYPIFRTSPYYSAYDRDYWSSTTDAQLPDYAFTSDTYGTVLRESKLNLNWKLHVRAVRGGQT
jgi:hypothetical protein